MSDHNRNYKRRSIYIDDATYSKLIEKAKSFDMSVSGFVRETASNELIPIQDPLPNELILELGRIGNNINQIARSYNQGHSPDDDLAKQLPLLLTQIKQIQSELRK